VLDGGEEMKIGDRVIIHDGSDADGDHGVVWDIQANGMVIVELDPDLENGIEEGCTWPVAEGELEQEEK
jgi:hypothetical protein